MNAKQPTTNLDSKTIASSLRRVLADAELDRVARDTGLMKRKRRVTPLTLVVACLSTLGSAKVQWLADILRTFNRFTGSDLQYKPFHKQLAKPAFAEFLRQVVGRAVAKLSIRTLRPVAKSKLAKFDDITIHDGTSFSLNDDLAKEWPGRFKTISPASMEIHATMSVARDDAVRVVLAPDKETERQFLPNERDLRNRLLLADRGYESRKVFSDIHEQAGFFIIRGNTTIKPTIRRAYRASGPRLRQLEGKVLTPEILPKENVDLDIDWGKGREHWEGRLVVLYTPRKNNKRKKRKKSRSITFTYLHTNLKHSEFRLREIAALYRLRWQIELLFKEWKSYANLHRFHTSKTPIAEGLVWASLLVSILKRFLCHAAQRLLGVDLSSMRAANSARHFLDDVLSGILANVRSLQRALDRAFAFLEVNARRAHPDRDRRRGRLASGLRLISVKD